MAAIQLPCARCRDKVLANFGVDKWLYHWAPMTFTIDSPWNIIMHGVHNYNGCLKPTALLHTWAACTVDKFLSKDDPMLLFP